MDFPGRLDITLIWTEPMILYVCVLSESYNDSTYSLQSVPEFLHLSTEHSASALGHVVGLTGLIPGTLLFLQRWLHVLYNAHRSRSLLLETDWHCCVGSTLGALMLVWGQLGGWEWEVAKLYTRLYQLEDSSPISVKQRKSADGKRFKCHLDLCILVQLSP